MQIDDWTLICPVLIVTARWAVSYLKTESHALLFFLYAPEPSMVLDTNLMASIFAEWTPAKA